jgi:DNA-binding NarL/FixJ family response regulator
MAGDAAGAQQALIELDSERHPGFPFLDPEIKLARAWVAAAEGAVSEAITLAHDAAAIAARCDQRAHEVLALHTAVRLGDGTVAGRLAELATRVDGPRAPAAAAHAAALVAADGDGLQAASVQLEQMGDLLAAVDAAAHAAAAYAQRAAAGSANAAATRAHQLAQACQGARTPALITVAQPLPLTRREREIVTLAGQGLSNKQIADRLVVSVRTVEGHLYRAGAKLGATHRDQLAALVRSDWPTNRSATSAGAISAACPDNRATT